MNAHETCEMKIWHAITKKCDFILLLAIHKRLLTSASNDILKKTFVISTFTGRSLIEDFN